MYALRTICTLLLSISFVACADENSSGDILVMNDAGSENDAGSLPNRDMGIVPDMMVDEPHYRHSSRLTVDHLRRSIPALFGGETWILQSGNRRFEGFDVPFARS